MANQTILTIDVPKALANDENFQPWIDMYLRNLGKGDRASGRLLYTLDQDGQADLTKEMLASIVAAGGEIYGWPCFWAAVEADAVVPEEWYGATITDEEDTVTPVLLKDHCINVEVDGQLYIRFKDKYMSKTPPIMTHEDFLRYTTAFPDYIIGAVAPAVATEDESE